MPLVLTTFSFICCLVANTTEIRSANTIVFRFKSTVIQRIFSTEMAVLYEEHLPAQNYQDALELLGESRETRENCLAEVNVWLDENPQINANRDVVFLLHFLRGAKFRMDKAKKRIET